MPERCPRCKSTHDSLDGVANHAWKTQDDAHSDITSKDEGMRLAVEEQNSDHDHPDDADSTDTTQTDSKPPDGDAADDSNPNSTDPTVSDGPPAVPDDPDDGDDTTPDEFDTLSCGCEIDPTELEDGTKYRCTDHGTTFTYHA